MKSKLIGCHMGRGEGGVRLNLDVQGQGGGRIFHVDRQGGYHPLYDRHEYIHTESSGL